MNEADKQQIAATWPQVQQCMERFGKEFPVTLKGTSERVLLRTVEV